LSALGTIYDRYADDVRRFAFRTTGRLDVAEDVTHDAFIELAAAAKRYDDRSSVRAFAIGIAAKLILRRRRRLAVAMRVFAQLGERLLERDDRTPESEAAEGEELARYRSAL